MSPASNGPPNVSPSGGGNANHNREAAAAAQARSFSSPDAHRPSSTNNDPLISPHHLGPQSFFPQQQPQQPPLTSMRPPTPGSPGSVKNAKNNNGHSILERALASTIKSEPVSTTGSAGSNTTTSVALTNGLDVAGHMGQMQEHWQHQQHQQQQLQQGPPQQFQYDEVMKPEIPDIGPGVLEYDINYSNAMNPAAVGQPGGPGSGVGPLHQGLPQGHHLTSNRGGHVLNHQLVHHQEDHLHSPSQYSTPLIQPPWVR